MPDWFAPVDQLLGAALLFAGLAALSLRRRGGRFRGLVGWVGFWVVLSAILVGLSRGPAWLALTVLGVLMFVGLRTYFFVTPLRPQDRYAILAAYLAIPVSLWTAYRGSHSTFLATVPILLFLLFPFLLSSTTTTEGLLDSLGRLFLGVLLFVFCAAHIGLLASLPQLGLLELFCVLALAAELPQRLLGRIGRDRGNGRATAGVIAGLLLATAIGFGCGPWVGLVEEDAARAGFLVALGVTMGTAVSGGLVRDLALGSSPSARGALLDRMIPAVYAAPFFFHYLNHFA